MAVERRLHRSAPAAAWALAGVAVAAIWAGVALATVYAPDFVSGSQQEHLPLVGWLDWIWGIIATGFVAMAVLRGIRGAVATLGPWIALAVGSAVVWLGVAAVSIMAPVFVTGSDPTRIPLTALGVPILGVFLTWFLSMFVMSAFEAGKE